MVSWIGPMTFKGRRAELRAHAPTHSISNPQIYTHRPIHPLTHLEALGPLVRAGPEAVHEEERGLLLLALIPAAVGGVVRWHPLLGKFHVNTP